MDRKTDKEGNKNRHGKAKGMNNETIEMLITLKSSNQPTQYHHEEKIMTNIHPISTDFQFDQYQVCKNIGLKIFLNLYSFLESYQ